MNGLSELSSALSIGLPLQSSGRGGHPFPFPGNTAVGQIPNALIPQVGGAESACHSYYLWTTQSYRNPPQRAGDVTEFLAYSRVLWEAGNQQLEADIDKLQAEYIFRNESAITRFILSHRTA